MRFAYLIAASPKRAVRSSKSNFPERAAESAPSLDIFVID
jgi:hypothetical protein